MAFIGLFAIGTVFILGLLAVFTLGILLIVVGRIRQKRLGKSHVLLKIIGYFLTVPVLFMICLFFLARFF